jgi:hypothetical protein
LESPAEPEIGDCSGIEAYSRSESGQRFRLFFSVRRTALPPILAGKAFVEYRRRKGAKQGVLPDFYFGAHAAVMQWPLLTRDAGRYRGTFRRFD